MDENNQQLNNQIYLNNSNHPQQQYEDIGQNNSSSKYNLLILIFNIFLGNISFINNSDAFHEFEHKTSFNGSNLINVYGEPKKESNSSK